MASRIKPASFPERHKRHESGADLDTLILMHIDIRMEHMTKSALFLRYVLRTNALAPCKIERGAATLQFGKGVRSEHTEAAHNLPCEVLVNGVPFWRILAYPNLQMDSLLKATIERNFASALVLPRYVNYVDSCWEQGGLVDAYKAYVTRVMALPDGAVLTLELDRVAGEFRDACRRTFGCVSESLKHRQPFEKASDEIGTTLRIYSQYIKSYDPRPILHALVKMLESALGGRG